MTKEELLKKIKDNELDIDIVPYTIELEEITDSPDVIGCAYENGKWKIYQTHERGGHFVIKEFDDQDKAYDYFYEVLLFERNDEL